MKICLMSYRGNPYCGGQGIYLMYLAREMVRLGHDVHVIVGPPYPFEMEGVTVHYIDNQNYFNKKNFIRPGEPFATLSPLNFYEFLASRIGIFPEIEAYSLRAFLYLRKLTREIQFDIIHDNQCLGYGFLFMKLLGIPVISTIHHPLSIDRATWFEHPSTFRDRMKRILYYPLIMQKFVATRLDHIITVSHDSAREIHKAFSIPYEKMSVVYNGLDTGLFHPLKGVKKKPNSLIFVGNVADRKKGVLYILMALKKSRHPVTLTIVDGGAPNRNIIPGLIDSLNLNDRVIFTGKIPLDRLIQLYAEHEIALSPSLYEGFGFPAAEAMACELPVIGSTAGALPEVIGTDEESGLIVPPRNADALAEAIDKLCDDAALRERLAKNGRKRILQLFTWEQAAKELVEVYRKVINAYR